VLAPGVPLGLLTNAVQTLAGVLLPSATVFLLLLCNDKAVLGPWVNSARLNIFTGIVIAVLVMLSVILTASVLFPGKTGGQILGILGVGTVVFLLIGAGLVIHRLRSKDTPDRREELRPNRASNWRMPPLRTLPPARLTLTSRIWMIVLRAYLVVAAGLVLFRIVNLALGQG
jgi:hypothetical protein